MPEFAQEESFPVLPIFLLVDVSYSMLQDDAIGAMNRSMPGLKEAIERDPTAGEMARISVITFSDTARTVLPLCDLQYADIPPVAPEAGTNFAAAFQYTRQEIENGLCGLGKGTRFYTPIVFFMSDGDDNSGLDWRNALHALTDRSWKFRPEIVTFGFADARPEQLAAISTKFAFIANNGSNPAEQVKEIIKALIGSIKVTSQSARSGGQPELTVPADPNTFTQLQTLEI